MAMNQLQIAIELQGMLAHLKHYQRINEMSTGDKAAAGAAYAYGHACRRIDKLFTKVLAEGVEINESDIQTTSGGGDRDTD
jgi:hypothetical protein